VRHTQRNPSSTSNLAILLSKAVLSEVITSRTSKTFPSLATTRPKNEIKIGKAHQNADVKESARHNSSGRYHFELTPSNTATRGYFLLLGTLLRRWINTKLSRATSSSSPSLKASAVFATSEYGGRLLKSASGTASGDQGGVLGQLAGRYGETQVADTANIPRFQAKFLDQLWKVSCNGIV
jgi:hypothetical protein